MHPTLVIVGAALLALGSLDACVSTETMSSAGIKPDAIAQAYSVVCSTTDHRCTSMAQFRLENHDGPTLELVAPRRVQINGRDATFYDSRIPNKIFDTLTYMTFLPLFKLYKTGSYYYTSGNYAGTHKFAFTDEEGRTARFEIPVRGFLPAEHLPAAVADLDRFHFVLAEGLVVGEEVSCILTLDPGQGERSRWASAYAKDGAVFCDFRSSDQQSLEPKVGDAYRLRVLRTRTEDQTDPFGRPVRVSASTEYAVGSTFVR